MSSGITTYYVLCPANYVTGGPEALHQLVDALRKLGRRAYISYVPMDGSHEVPPAFRGYDVVVGRPNDTPDELVIAPESATGLLRQFKYARRAVWWLSIDYYFAREYKSWLADTVRRLRFIITRRDLSFAEMRSCLHYCQSEYASSFVASRGLDSMRLSDYSTVEVTDAVGPARLPRILYNPKKGLSTTRRLVQACSNREFKPLVGLNRSELVDVLRTSMLYIDFGQHPGRDRLPREAAAAGCCVITGRRGSAAFAADLPIDDTYKLDEDDPRFESKFKSLVADIVDHFDTHHSRFGTFRSSIAEEKRRFLAEVDASFPS